MKTFITFINIKQVSTLVHYPAIQSTEWPMSRGAHCNALALNNANTLNNLGLNAMIVKCN